MSNYRRIPRPVVQTKAVQQRFPTVIAIVLFGALTAATASLTISMSIGS